MENVINYPVPEMDRKQALFEEAKKKLDEGLKGKYNRHGEVMKQHIRDVLLDFCQQNEEFAESVAQGSTFQECMKTVSKAAEKAKGNYFSDVEAYAMAVKFFFPGAGIDVKMTINLADSVEQEAEAKEEQEKSEKRGPVMVSLNDFFNV